METWKIAGFTLEYDDDDHLYIIDGVIVPSITQMLSVKFGNKYDFVNKATLERAANRGTAIHKAIENFCKSGEQEELKEVHNFNFLMNYYGLKVLENETPIILFKDETPIAAGRLDLILDNNGKTCVADIKTTSVLDKEYLAYQLNLYRLGYTQSYSIKVDELYGVHLRENKRKLVKIPVNEAVAWNIVDEYERSNNE